LFSLEKSTSSLGYSNSLCFLGATGAILPECSKLTFSCKKHPNPKADLEKEVELSCKEKHPEVVDEFDYTVDSLTWDSTLKVKHKTKETVKVSFEVCAQ
jgi:hypothetical protein